MILQTQSMTLAALLAHDCEIKAQRRAVQKIEAREKLSFRLNTNLQTPSDISNDRTIIKQNTPG
jgi:hypothetical protein